MEEQLLTPIGGKSSNLFDKLTLIFENMRPPDVWRVPTSIQKRSRFNSSSSNDVLIDIKRSRSSSVLYDQDDIVPVRLLFFYFHIFFLTFHDFLGIFRYTCQ